MKRQHEIIFNCLQEMDITNSLNSAMAKNMRVVKKVPDE